MPAVSWAPARSRLLPLLGALLLIAGLLPSGALAVAPTTAPTLVAPADSSTVSANPTLSWTAVSGAAKYKVQVSTNAAFSGTLSYSVDTVNTKATPPSDLPLGLLYWRVAAMDSASAIGPWSPTFEFTKAWGASPNLTAPGDGASLDFPGTPVRFSWNPLPGAKTYRLEIDDAADFVGASSYTTNNTNFTLTEPQTVGQQFFWRVQGTAAGSGVVSDWSETRSYTFTWSAIPTLTDPTDGDVVTDVVLEWNPVPGAKTYQLQVSPNQTFDNNVTIDAIVKGTRYSPPTTIGNGAYFWRVRAKDARGTPNNGDWSATFTFTRNWLEQPSITAPAWNSGDPDNVPLIGTPTLEWTPVHHASHYELWIGTDVNFNTNTFSKCFTNHTRVTPYSRTSGQSGEPGSCSIPQGNGELYYWKVRAIDAPAGILGLWSSETVGETFRFRYSPDIPDLVAPGDGASVDTPTLEWTGVESVDKYVVTIKKAGGANAKVVTTYATSYTPDSLNPADGPFSWYVTTVDGDGNAGMVPDPSTWRTFSINPSPTTSTSFAITSPADASSHVRMPKMTWEPYTGAAHYKVIYGPSGGAYLVTPLSGATLLQYAGFTYASTPLAAGTYKFKIEAYDGVSATPIATSAEQTFTMDLGGVLNFANYTAPTHCAVASSCTTLADTPTLEWNSVPGAGSYKVTLAADAEFTNVIKTYGTSFTTLTPREDLLDSQAGQATYWFVQPCVARDLTRCGPGPDTSARSNARAFRKASAPVTLLDPPHNSVRADQITFTWEDYLDTNGALTPGVDDAAKSYKIEVSQAADFATILDSATVDQPTYTPFSKTYPEGPLYWRVQAIDGSSNALTKSPIRLVTKTSNPVSLSLPANAATVTGVPYFQWNPKTFAATYTVEVYKNGDLNFSSTNKVLTATTKFAAWAPTTSLASGTYAWRVRGNDADARALPWSTGRTFKLQPAAPTLISPASGATFLNNNLLFTWQGVSGAASYKWEASTVSNFATIAYNAATVMTAWAPTAAIADGAYYWRVKAIDAAGNTISTSSSRTFTKDATKPTVTAKTPTVDASILGPFTVTFSEQVKNVSTSTFKMVIAGTNTAVAGTVTPSSSSLTTTATFTPTSRLIPGQSYTLSLTSGITDKAGNALVPFTWTVRTSLTVDSSSSALVQVWDRDTHASASGGAYESSRTVGAKTVFTFTGTNVSVLGRKASDGGKADIYLDGVKQATVDFYNAATQWQQTMWSKTGLSSAKHTVEVRVLNQKSAASTSTWVYVDAFKVGTTVYQENNSAVRDAFRVISNASAYGGSYLTTSHSPSTDTTQPYYTLTFKGTDVMVYATRTSGSGKAGVYVDGALKATIDLYAAATTYKVKVFDSATLADGQHTLTIKVLGTKSAASSGYEVSVDQIVLK